MTLLAQGQALLAGGRFQEAQGVFRQLLAQDAASLDARLGLAQAFAGSGDGWSATAFLSDACRIAPAALEPAVHLAEMLLAQQLHAQALHVYRRLYHELGARDRATLLHYGFCLEHTGELEAAVERYREAVTREPGFFEAHVDLAGVLWRLEDFDGSLAHARAAVNLAPNHPYAVRILGTALLNLNRVDEAEVHLRRALALKPDFELAQLDLAFALLLAGRLEEGWSWYEKRWLDTNRLRRPPFFRPALEWQGPRQQPLRGRRIVVYAEQGLGDVIQFVRLLPRLQEQGATVIAALQPQLAALVEHSFEGVSCPDGERGVQADLHAALLDLPGRLGVTLETLPAQVPYLRVPPAARARWREQLAPWTDRVKVGLAWCGFRGQVNNRNRAMPLSELLPLLDLPGVQGFSLQKADAGPYSDVQPGPERLVDLTGGWQDFTDSAAVVEQLDLVVTVDTSIAHLAGALGKPVWVLLPPNPDFRWLLDRDDSPWYPTVRLFRRGFGEPRAGQVGRAVRALEALLAQQHG